MILIKYTQYAIPKEIILSTYLAKTSTLKVEMLTMTSISPQYRNIKIQRNIFQIKQFYIYIV